MFHIRQVRNVVSIYLRTTQSISFHQSYEKMKTGSLGLIFFLVTVSIIIVQGSTLFGLPSPWLWACREKRGCVKVPKEQLKSPQKGDDMTNPTLAGCKLTCVPGGNLWPKPRGDVSVSKTLVKFQLSDISVTKISAPTSKVRGLTAKAINIFRDEISMGIPAEDVGKTCIDRKGSTENASPQINLHITIVSDEARLDMNTTESYNLEVTTDSRTPETSFDRLSTTNIHITAPTFFGARHALETLSQLIAWDDAQSSMIMNSDVDITDSPAYIHRGLIIDSSRNFITVPVIKKIIDAMSYDKLNVFHWHLTDTHSFPFVSSREPRLAQYGSYSPSQVYLPGDVMDLVDYATVRGVKIIPEFDAPAHVGSGWEWGEKDGMGQLALCVNKEPWTTYCVEPPCGILNPVNDNVYSVLKNIYKDMAQLFPSDVFHMGGDEVNFRCWNETKEITDWMESHDREDRTKEDFLHLWKHFQDRALKKVDEAYENKPPVILWTSGLTEEGHADKYLDKDRYIIQIWTNSTDKSIADLYRQGFKLIMSNFDALYFDCGYGQWVGDGPNNWCSPYIGWQKVYENSPRRIINNLDEKYSRDQMLGGEAAMWSEQVDSATIEGKLWPRSSALGERLWTDPDTTWRDAEIRMIHHRQRLFQRGIMADAIQPEWCHQQDGYCFLDSVKKAPAN